MTETDDLEARLRELEAHGLRRRVDQGEARAATEQAATRLGRALIDVSSNDYLGLGTELVSRETLTALAVCAGGGASRLLNGSRPEHGRLERQLASWTGAAEALLFSSGYALNASVIPALVERGDAVFSDALNHASLVDGCRLSRATIRVYSHVDLAALSEALRSEPARRRLVVTESYFSMDGDGPDLVALRRLCDDQGAMLYVDEAHALGVFGPRGAGLCAAAGVRPDVLVGTLGKAIGTQGAFAAGTTALRDWLWNRARGFVFSTALSPLLAAVTQTRLDHVLAADADRCRLEQLATSFRLDLQRRALSALPSFGPIVPILVPGDPRRAVALADQLRERAVLAQAIRPPTVPVGTSRLRLTLHARLSDDDLAYLGDQLQQLLVP